MGNSVLVYRSQREQMMDEFWMSEDGMNTMFVMVLFFVGALGTARLASPIGGAVVECSNAERGVQDGKH